MCLLIEVVNQPSKAYKTDINGLPGQQLHVFPDSALKRRDQFFRQNMHVCTAPETGFSATCHSVVSRKYAPLIYKHLLTYTLRIPNTNLVYVGV